jgi:lipopolysaccharide/colanic/teichoic acid biosynthesis glycosyltransferase
MTASQSVGSGNVTVKNDARLFRGAALLRALKIDELPQLINVVRGEMSLIGPRPTTADDYERMTLQQQARSLARPGLSGLAQISGNTSLSWPQRIAHDLDYVEKATFAMDARIVGSTIWMIVAGRLDSHPTSDDEWEI